MHDRSDWHTIAGEDQRPDRYGGGRSARQPGAAVKSDGAGRRSIRVVMSACACYPPMGADLLVQFLVDGSVPHRLLRAAMAASGWSGSRSSAMRAYTLRIW